jgi:hypothetical protein
LVPGNPANSRPGNRETRTAMMPGSLHRLDDLAPAGPCHMGTMPSYRPVCQGTLTPRSAWLQAFKFLEATGSSWNFGTRVHRPPGFPVTKAHQVLSEPSDLETRTPCYQGHAVSRVHQVTGRPWSWHDLGTKAPWFQQASKPGSHAPWKPCWPGFLVCRSQGILEPSDQGAVGAREPRSLGTLEAGNPGIKAQAPGQENAGREGIRTSGAGGG